MADGVTRATDDSPEQVSSQNGTRVAHGMAPRGASWRGVTHPCRSPATTGRVEKRRPCVGVRAVKRGRQHLASSSDSQCDACSNPSLEALKRSRRGRRAALIPTFFGPPPPDAFARGRVAEQRVSRPAVGTSRYHHDGVVVSAGASANATMNETGRANQTCRSPADSGRALRGGSRGGQLRRRMIVKARRTASVGPSMRAPCSRRARVGVMVAASSISNVGRSHSIVTSALTGAGPDRGVAVPSLTRMWKRSTPIVKS